MLSLNPATKIPEQYFKMGHDCYLSLHSITSWHCQWKLQPMVAFNMRAWMLHTGEESMVPCYHSCYSDYTWAGQSRVQILLAQVVFLFSILSRSAVGDGVLSTAAKQPGHLVLRLKKSGAVPPLYQISLYSIYSYTFLWRINNVYSLIKATRTQCTW